MDDPVALMLLQCHDVEEKNSEQLKPISAQKKQALETYRQRMIRENKTCIPLNDHWYVVLDTVDKKTKNDNGKYMYSFTIFFVGKRDSMEPGGSG